MFKILSARGQRFLKARKSHSLSTLSSCSLLFATMSASAASPASAFPFIDAQVVHTETNMCLKPYSTGEGQRMVLRACDYDNAFQRWNHYYDTLELQNLGTFGCLGSDWSYNAIQRDPCRDNTSRPDAVPIYLGTHWPNWGYPIHSAWSPDWCLAGYSTGVVWEPCAYGANRQFWWIKQ